MSLGRVRISRITDRHQHRNKPDFGSLRFFAERKPNTKQEITKEVTNNEKEQQKGADSEFNQYPYLPYHADRLHFRMVYRPKMHIGKHNSGGNAEN